MPLRRVETMMWKTGILAGFSAAILIAACAYPEVNYRDPDKTSSSSKQSSSVTSGPGGMGGSGGATVTTSTTAMGGSGGGPCNPLDSVACAQGQKCSVANENTGELGCVTAGSTLLYSACTTDEDCEPTTYCDSFGKVCKKFCNTNNQCPASRPCVLVLNSQDIPIPNVGVCMAPCEPKSASPCDPASTNCVPIGLTDANNNTILEWDCQTAGPLTEDEKCAALSECSHGLYCYNRNVSASGNQCIPWCKPGDSCGTVTFCKEIQVPIGPNKFDAIYNSVHYGVCDIL